MNSPPLWTTLEDLYILANAGGCTNAQFEEAVDAVGANPSDVADYLQRYGLNWNMPKQNRRGR